MTSTFVPYKRSNLAAYVSVDSDATSPDYGQMRVIDVHRPAAAGPRPGRQRRPLDTEVADQLGPVQAERRARGHLRQPADRPGRRRADVRRAGLRRRAGLDGRATRSCATCWSPSAARSASARRCQEALGQAPSATPEDTTGDGDRQRRHGDTGGHRRSDDHRRRGPDPTRARPGRCRLPARPTRPSASGNTVKSRRPWWTRGRCSSRRRSPCRASCRPTRRAAPVRSPSADAERGRQPGREPVVRPRFGPPDTGAVTLCSPTRGGAAR